MLTCALSGCQHGPDDRGAGKGGAAVIVLDPVLSLLEHSVAVAGEVFGEEGAVGLLRIEHDLVAAHTVDVDIHIAQMRRGQTQLPRNPPRRLLANLSGVCAL